MFLFQLVWGENPEIIAPLFWSFTLFKVQLALRMMEPHGHRSHTTSNVQSWGEPLWSLGAHCPQDSGVWGTWREAGRFPFPLPCNLCAPCRAPGLWRSWPTLFPAKSSKYRTQWFHRLGFLQLYKKKSVADQICICFLSGNKAPVDFAADFWPIVCPCPPLQSWSCPWPSVHQPASSLWCIFLEVVLKSAANYISLVLYRL